MKNYYIKTLLTSINDTLKNLSKVRRAMRELGLTPEEIPEPREATAKLAYTGRSLAKQFEADGILTPSKNGYLIQLPDKEKETYINCNMFKY